jgi:hypothetical protein|tara:strand:- start:851 stop:1891 length:1041 start_codon:yes stop_codon:yes gene_type:complete
MEQIKGQTGKIMQHSGKISLHTVYDSTPSAITVTVGQEKIFDGELQKAVTLDFQWFDDNSFKIKISKTGKTMAVVKRMHRQEVVVENLSINGFTLHPEKFGEFKSNDNPFVADSTLQTNRLDLNGEWTLDVPLFPLHGIATLRSYKEFRDTLSDSDTACFGCSFTYGTAIEPYNTWPAVLGSSTGRIVKNYGIGGSNNQEIIANALEYVSNYKTNNVILMLCHFCRLQLAKGGQIYNWHPTSDIQDFFPDQLRQMVNHGETSLLFAGQVPYFTNMIEKIKRNISGNVYVSTYIEDHYKCLEKIAPKDFILLPFYELSKDLQFASDGQHPGPEHNRLFAERISKYIK